MTSLRTLLSLAVAAALAAPVAAGAAVTATTISEPVTDPSVLVFVEPAGLPLTVSGTSNGGTGRLDLRCEGAATAVVDANVRPTAAGVWTTTLSAAAVSRLTPRTCYLHAVPHGNAGHQPHGLRRQARHVPALARDRRRRRPQQRRPVRLPLLGAAVARPLDLAVGLRLRPGGRLDDRADDLPRLGLGVPVRGLHRPHHVRAAPACSSITPTPTCPYAAATLFPARPTRSACSPRRPRSATDPSTGNVLIRETENLLRCSPDAATVPATRADVLVLRLGRRQARPPDHPAGRRQAGARHRHLVGHRRAPPPDRRLLRGSPRRQRAGRLVPVGRRLHLLPARLHADAARRRRRSASSRARRRALADGDVNNAQGAITLQDRPTALRFRTGAAIWTQYVRTLTPETPTHISFGFSWATAQAELTTLIGQAERALGPTHCLVPNLVGRTLVDSKRLLLAGHCKVGKVKYATSKVRRKDRVIQQGHRPATTLAGGSSVTLLVSSRLIGKSRRSVSVADAATPWSRRAAA